MSPAPTSLVLAETAVTVAAIYAVWWWFLRRHRTAARHAAKESPANELEPPVVCSFCGKSQDQVRKIIAGPKVYICDECIDLCDDIIAEEYKQEDGSRTAPRSGPPVVLPWLGAGVLAVLLLVVFATPGAMWACGLAWPIALILLVGGRGLWGLSARQRMLWLALVIGGTVVLYLAPGR